MAVLKIIYRYIRDLIKLPYYLYLLNKTVCFNKVEGGIVIVSPSLTLSGAPLLSEAIYNSLNVTDLCIFVSMYGGDGVKVEHNKSLNLSGCNFDWVKNLLIKRLISNGYTKFLCNSIVSSTLAPLIKNNGGRVVTLVHEMRSVIMLFGLENQIRRIATASDSVVFSSNSTHRDFVGFFKNIKNFNAVFMKQGVYNCNVITKYNEKNDIKERERINHSINKRAVLGIGNDLNRKGFDYFKELALLCSNTHIFIWVGESDELSLVSSSKDNICVVETVPMSEIYKYFYMSDVFFLSSIEDPFPSVILEAMASGLPIISLKGSGGADEIVNESNGFVCEKNRLEDAEKYLNSLKLEIL
jgi:glycosyltransferase involved in cell wall biosynthesis